MNYGYIRFSTDKSRVKKLTGKEAQIKELLSKNISKSAIARLLGVHRLTVSEFIKISK
jgi:DNA invertase Pin-like site-specific DNA recombinase